MRQSAGLLPFRMRGDTLEVFLVHPGGPYWARKDLGAWSIAKGEFADGDDPLAAARREFNEETGFVAEGPFIPLDDVKQKAGKTVLAWAFQGDFDPRTVKSNTFTCEWPPQSGKQQEFPEIDRAEWFTVAEARRKLNEAQAAFVDRLVAFSAGVDSRR